MRAFRSGRVSRVERNFEIHISSSILRKRKETRLSAACVKIRKSLDSFGHDIDWCTQLRYVHATLRAHPIFSCIYRQDTKKRTYLLNPNGACIKMHGLYLRKNRIKWLMNDKLLRENERDSFAGLINIVPRCSKKVAGGDLPLFLSLSFFLQSNENFLRYHHLCRQEWKN